MIKPMGRVSAQSIDPRSNDRVVYLQQPPMEPINQLQMVPHNSRESSLFGLDFHISPKLESMQKQIIGLKDTIDSLESKNRKIIKKSEKRYKDSRKMAEKEYKEISSKINQVLDVTNRNNGIQKKELDNQYLKLFKNHG